MWWFFFFSSRRRHTRLQGDWSSDVCSSDLGAEESGDVRPGGAASGSARGAGGSAGRDPRGADQCAGDGEYRDRKSVVEGKRVDLGGRRIIKKKKNKSTWRS